MSAPLLHIIVGPTASGKSKLAMEIARHEGGTIINADAMQIYQGLPILTAQPSKQDRAEIPHELYEVFDPSKRSSAGKWRVLASEAIERTVKARRTPIIVGGTGLYFRALLEGLADIPDIPESIRSSVQKLYDELGHELFRAELMKIDPESATRIKPGDRQRLIRAYEVARYTGRSIGYWQTCSSSRINITGFEIKTHLLLPPRKELYAACDKRFLEMMERGAVDEVKSLLAKKLDPNLPAMKIIGVREITAFLRGDISKDEAIRKAQQATRNYAKRQITWFKNQKLLSGL